MVHAEALPVDSLVGSLPELASEINPYLRSAENTPLSKGKGGSKGPFGAFWDWETQNGNSSFLDPRGALASQPRTGRPPTTRAAARAPWLMAAMGTLPSVAPPSQYTAIEGAAIPEVDYDTLLGLFQGKHSAMLSDRHAAAILRVCRVHERGFPIRDIPMLQQVLQFAYGRVGEGKAAIFEEALCTVMRCVCS